jgi:uncharacterized protein HemY
VRAWRERKRKDKADQALLDALRAFIDGNEQKASELADKAVESDLAPDLVERLRRPASAEPATPH